METTWYIIEAGACLIGYAIIANRTMKLSSVLLRTVCDLSARLLADERMPVALQNEIRGIVPHLAKQWIAWAFVIMTPVAIFSRVHVKEEPQLSDDLMKSWRTLQRLSVAAGLLNSPAATVIFVLIIGIVSFFASFNGLIDMILLRVVNWPSLPKGSWFSTIIRGT